VSIFDLNSVPEGRGRTAASVRADKERKKLEQVWHNAPIKDEDGIKKYEEWLDQTTRRGDDHGLLAQTILEEDDDSEDEF
jgi:hypothetical protein